MSFWKHLLSTEVKPYEQIGLAKLPEPAPLPVTVEEPVEVLTEFPVLPEGFEWAVTANMVTSEYHWTIQCHKGYLLQIIDKSHEFSDSEHPICSQLMCDPELVSEKEMVEAKDRAGEVGYYSVWRNLETHYKEINKEIILSFAGGLFKEFEETLEKKRKIVEDRRIAARKKEESDSFLGTYPPNELDKPVRGEVNLKDKFGITNRHELYLKAVQPEVYGELTEIDAKLVWKAVAYIEDPEMRQMIQLVSTLARLDFSES